MKTIAFWHLDCWTAQVLDGDPGQSRGIHCPYSRVRCDLVLIRTGGSEDRSMLLACLARIRGSQGRKGGCWMGAKEGQKTNRRTATGKAASARMSTQAANTRILSRFGVRLARLDSKTSR